MGAKPIAYWLAYFFCDMSIFIMVVFVFRISLNIFRVGVLSDPNIFSLIYCCYMAYISWTYLFSWLFNSYKAAIKSLIVI